MSGKTTSCTSILILYFFSIIGHSLTWFYSPLQYSWASLVAQNPPSLWETWVQSLGWEDTLVKGKATHSSILAQKIPWTAQSMGLQRARHD